MARVRRATGRARVVLLCAHAAGEDGWTPDELLFHAPGTAAAARRLWRQGWLERRGDDEVPDYVVTEEGRAALRLGPARPLRALRTAVRNAMRELGIEPQDWEIRTGRRLPVIPLDDDPRPSERAYGGGEADFRGCTFALVARDAADADVRGFLRAIDAPVESDGVRWDALARRVSELGFPVLAEGCGTSGVMGFWPVEVDGGSGA